MMYTYITWIPSIVIETLCCRLGHSNQMNKKYLLCTFELILRTSVMRTCTVSVTMLKIPY